ncbi:MAG: hypothetical protein V8S32_06550 [Lachnospiraceae bacterium]
MTDALAIGSQQNGKSLMLKQSGLLSKTKGFIDEIFKVHFKGYDLRVMTLFQKQQRCLSNKATTTCRQARRKVR